MPSPGRVGILVSGRGSNMRALLDAMAAGRIAASPALVVSNVAGAPALALAAERGVATRTIDHRHEPELLAALAEHAVDLVCLAGYMRLLGPPVIAAFRDRIFNVHPSLLPAFPGLNAQRQALERGVKVAGATVHVVDEVCDAGPIILQAAVPVHDDDTEDSLALRILEQEHRIYPEAVALHYQGRLRLEHGRVRIASASPF